MGKRRLRPLLMFGFLLVATLSSFAGPARAQADQLQYVVTYMEFKPADTKAGRRVLDDLASEGLASTGVIRFDVLQQVDRRNFFALFEIWSSAQTFAAFQSSAATQAIFTRLTPLLGAPLDERDGNLLDGTVILAVATRSPGISS
jgi:quinol monooxygenase YgiN